jgi:C1A family cysteine protease
MKKNIIVIFMISLLLLVIVPEEVLTKETHLDDEKTDLEEIKQAISESNAKWNADYTFMSNSSQLINECCSTEIFKEIDDDSFNDRVVTSSLPGSFDWRNVGGTDWTTPIKLQGNCGSCVAHATVAALETVVQIESGQPFGCDLSEAHLFFCSGGSCTGGLPLISAANFISSVGVADELCFPYNAWQMDCDEKESNWQNRTVSAKHKTFSSTQTASVKQALINHGPIVTFLYVYYDFIYYTGGIYEHVWGTFGRIHAVTIVGYNDMEGYWICKNSFGEDWGEKNPYDSESEGGWFRIKYDEVNMGTGGFYVFYDFSGNLHPHKPTDLIPIDGEKEVEPDDRLHWSCTDPDGDELYYNIYLKEGLNDFNPTEEYLVAEGITDTVYHFENLNIKKDSRYVWLVEAEDEYGSKKRSDVFSFETRKLYDPILEGPSRIKIGEEYTFTASTPETDGEAYYWFFDWGDGSNSDWLGPYGPNDSVSISHIWDKKGEVNVKVRYMEDEIYSDFSTLGLPVQKNELSTILFFYLSINSPQFLSLLLRVFD